MPSEKKIKDVLDLLTTVTVARVEALSAPVKSKTRDMRQIIEQKNIVALGIAEKISNKRKTGKLALTFYVEKKIPLSKLKGDAVIPPTVPESLSGALAIPTDVIVVGKLRPELPNVTRTSLQPGYSVGHVKVSAGTFGAVVTDGKDYFILSNSHVLADSGKGKEGDVILYPGKHDGGIAPADKIGILHRFLPFTSGGDFVNKADCAIAKIDESKLGILDSKIKDLVIPSGVVKPKRGMKVTKVGRTTGKTVGEITDVNFRTTINYGAGVGMIGFLDQVFCTRYTDSGDSGSLVLDQQTMKAVGLHFAGSEAGSIFSPIDIVLKELDVKLVTSRIGTGSVPSSLKKKKKTAKKTSKKKSLKKTT